MRTRTIKRSLIAAAIVAAAIQPCSSTLSAAPAPQSKIGRLLLPAAAAGIGWSPVIVRAVDQASVPLIGPMIRQAGGILGRPLPLINGHAAYVPNGIVTALANSAAVAEVSLDRPVLGAMERTGPTVGATSVRQDFGYDGTGIGVAIIDSGLTSWHDDLAGPDGSPRVDRFVDFVGNGQTPYDDYGHGTHVAGIVAGNGFDSGGARSGIAPGVRLTVLKVLDANGAGRISDVIAALDYVVANRDALNIRVVNLSVASGVYESYTLDPLTLAAKNAVAAGIVVVAAAGNAGRDPSGHPMYGGITAPGNAPWVLTVGASSHMGTVDRSDDTIAPFSSRGPTAVNYGAKPDIAAPGVGIESLSDPASTLYSAYSASLLNGSVPTTYLPYLSLSGTSMAAPVVSGTVALMLQANPKLTPNAVKAILQYTAQKYPDYDALTQGAGFLNTRGAIELARHFATPDLVPYPDSSDWSHRLIWGNRVIQGGRLASTSSAWSADVEWGATASPDGSDLVWGTIDETTDAWSGIPAMADNIVWGSTCGGADCGVVWTVVGAGGAAVSSDGDTVVWGSSGDDTVVWGSSSGDPVVWGSSGGDTVVWGSSCNDPACTPTVWR
jgi:serine protease AprX